MGFSCGASGVEVLFAVVWDYDIASMALTSGLGWIRVCEILWFRLIRRSSAVVDEDCRICESLGCR